ncbi:MAG: transposase, partial [Chloroflexota bacterium]|nr:transposase [Chloroflexota bacterium]
RDLVDVHFPEADRICVVLDNLNTHVLGSLYRRFAPAEAWRIAQKLELHYTPKHGSWLNMAELEFSALQRMCLQGRRLPSREHLATEVVAWVAERNAAHVTVSWTFTPEDARRALPQVYPSHPKVDNQP